MRAVMLAQARGGGQVGWPGGSNPRAETRRDPGHSATHAFGATIRSQQSGQLPPEERTPLPAEGTVPASHSAAWRTSREQRRAERAGSGRCSAALLRAAHIRGSAWPQAPASGRRTARGLSPLPTSRQAELQRFAENRASRPPQSTASTPSLPAAGPRREARPAAKAEADPETSSSLYGTLASAGSAMSKWFVF